MNDVLNQQHCHYIQKKGRTTLTSLGMRHLLVKLVVAKSRFVNLRHPGIHRRAKNSTAAGPCALAPEPENGVTTPGMNP